MGRKIRVIHGFKPRFINQHTQLIQESTSEYFVGGEDSHDSYIHTFETSEIKPFKDVLREIIETRYKNLGGTRVPLTKVLSEDNTRFRVFSLDPDPTKHDKFYAVAIHKIAFGHPRLRYIAGRIDEEKLGTKGVYALIEYELNKEGYCYFAEVSGAVEHMYAKSNGYIVPNIYVADLLGVKKINCVPVEGDLFHYVRDFGDGNKFIKALYGFKNKKNYDDVSKKIENNSETFVRYNNYEEFRKEANYAIVNIKKLSERLQSIMEQDNENVYYILDAATEFFVRLEELHDDLQFNEFPEKVFEQAEFMLYVVKELGTPSQYNEALKTYKRWRAEVTPFVLITKKF